MPPRSCAFLILASIAIGAPAAAHHGFTGRYDTDRPIWLVGTVTATSFSPPHPIVTVSVDARPALPRLERAPAELTGPVTIRAEDSGQTRTVEFPPVQTFFSLGERIKVGDRVEIVALKNCRPPHQLRSQWLRLADGTVTARDGRLAYMARGCDG